MKCRYQKRWEACILSGQMGCIQSIRQDGRYADIRQNVKYTIYQTGWVYAVYQTWQQSERYAVVQTRQP